jgi:hypothetical protein
VYTEGGVHKFNKCFKNLFKSRFSDKHQDTRKEKKLGFETKTLNGLASHLE